jgi:hypothetical protein
MSQVNITLNTNTVDINTTNNQIVVTDPTNPTTVNITQPVTQLVEVITSGPQGIPGDPSSLTGSFVSTSSFNAFTSSYNTGSFLGSFTGSLEGTGSYALQALSASYAENSNSASYAISSSFATNALTASYLEGYISPFPFTGSALITGSLGVTGSIQATSISGSFSGSGANLFDIPASGIVGLNLSQISSGSVSASISPDNGLQVNTNVTATSFTGSLFGTASYALNGLSSSYAVSSSFTQTASFAPNYTLTSTFNNFTGSYNTGSFTGSFTGSLFGTASFAVSSSQALSSSFATSASFVTSASFAVSSSRAISSSFATTASYALNGGVTQLLAGPNVTLSPTTGVGQVTISSIAGGGGFNTATGSYGSFYDTTNQTNPVANIPRSMSLNTTDITNGVSVSGSTNPFNTYIKTENAGIYNIQFSAQVEKTDSGTDVIVIWLRKNGIDLTDSATKLTLSGNNTKVVAAWNWFVSSAANDYYQIIWVSADTGMRLYAEPINDTPGIPSVIVTANRVDQFLSNTGSFTGSFTGQFTGSLQGTSSFAISSSFAQTASFVPGGVTGTGANGQVAFWNGTNSQTGDNGLFWDNTNKRLGVGTATPATALDVNGTARVNGNVPISTYVAQIINPSNSPGMWGLNIVGGNNDNARILTCANGTQTILVVKGNRSININSPLPTGNYATFFVANAFSGFPTFLVRGNGSTSEITFQTQNSSGTALLTTLDNGNVLIGTTTDAGFRLDVNGTTRLNGNTSIGGGTAGARLDVRAQGALSTDIAFRVRNSADTLDTVQVRGDGVTNFNLATGQTISLGHLGGTSINIDGSRTLWRSGINHILGDSQDQILLRTGTANRVCVNSVGNVGIGTVTPQARLDVNGNTIITGSLQVSQSLFQYSNNAAITSGSTANIASFPTSSYTAGFFDFVATSGTNARAGTVFTVWNANNVEFTETSTNDIGNTSNLILSASLSAGAIRLQGTSLSGSWSVKTLTRMI